MEYNLNTLQDSSNFSSGKPENYYANTAYSSEIWKVQSPPKPHTLSGMKPLPFADYRDVSPTTYMFDAYEVIHAAQPTKDESERIPFRFDAQMIRTVTSSRAFMNIFCTLGGYFLLIGSLVTVVVAAALMLWGSPTKNHYEAAEFVLFSSLAGFVVSVGMIMAPKLPYSIAKFIFGKIVPDIEINRQTGMITKWRYVPFLGFKRKPWVKPFEEFIPYINTLITPTATSAGVQVVLMHKDSRRFSFGSYGLANLTDQADALAFWDFLQRFMDVDQPLPDIPFLEATRQQDPTTREFDKKVNRPERFWRDMTENQINKKANDMEVYVSELAHGMDLPRYQYDYTEFSNKSSRKNKAK